MSTKTAFCAAIFVTFISFLNTSSYSSHLKREVDDKPSFNTLLPTNLTVQQGDTAYLSCGVFTVGNESVSWVRERDSHIIAVDQETFISDERFLSVRKIKDNLWILKIKNVSARDAGKYECQVSTAPKISRWIDLVVVVPKVRIFGGPDIYVREGSALQLECVISQTIVSPRFVVWQFNGELVPGSSFIKVQDSPSTSSSTLNVGRVSRYQAGNYSCHPDNLHPAIVSLHVLSKDGERLQPSLNMALERNAVAQCYLLTNFIVLFLQYMS